MKKIQIFLASSLVELTSERLIIENFIRNISDSFEETYNIKIQPLLCENFDDAFTKGRKQEEYNEKIRESEFCFFVFFTKVGKYAREEFDVAKTQFEKTGKPKIYTYFKTVEEGQAQQSIYDFMEELDKTFGHYYGTFSHIDTIKLRILLSLKLQEMDFVELKVENGKCVVDGSAVMSVENVSEFANNENLEKLQKELAQAEEEYYSLKARYEKEEGNAEFYSNYSKVASKRQNLIDEIDQLQKLIFNVSLRMVKDDIHGEISAKQKKAYKLFEMGDYDGCMSVLNAEDIDNDFEKAMQRNEEERIAICRKYIKEHKTAIDILGAMKKYSGRFDEIIQRYEKIIPYIIKMKIELDTAFEYVKHLIDQNDEDNALRISKQLLPLCETDEHKGKVIGWIALAYIRKGSPDAEKYCQQAIEIKEELAEKDFLMHGEELVKSYNNAGIFYKDHNNPEMAEKNYLLAIDLCEKLADNNRVKFNRLLAICYHNTGVFYDEYDKPEKAEKYFLDAIEIREKLAQENPDIYNAELASSYASAGVLYRNLKQPEKATEYSSKSLNIYKSLAHENPAKCNPILATMYFNHALVTRDVSLLLRALALAKMTPDNYECRLIIERIKSLIG